MKKVNQVKNQWQTKETAQLFKAIAKIGTTRQAEQFIRDLCTLDEIYEMARRWQAVRMINQGKSYREIAAKTGLSTTTVTRVAYWLNYGEGGYRAILKKTK
ncbi:MAG: YerC/YecD family TrpR-related protein [Patescibacteria group bacterium]|jgi:TrpR-related protein YerC/YecD|nr:YerC/YecD family TrpR-related protein [Patescibacteria group bacterium]